MIVNQIRNLVDRTDFPFRPKDKEEEKKKKKKKGATLRFIRRMMEFPRFWGKSRCMLPVASKGPVTVTSNQQQYPSSAANQSAPPRREDPLSLAVQGS